MLLVFTIASQIGGCSGRKTGPVDDDDDMQNTIALLSSSLDKAPAKILRSKVETAEFCHVQVESGCLKSYLKNFDVSCVSAEETLEHLAAHCADLTSK
jgi:hypothetical protein